MLTVPDTSNISKSVSVSKILRILKVAKTPFYSKVSKSKALPTSHSVKQFLKGPKLIGRTGHKYLQFSSKIVL